MPSPVQALHALTRDYPSSSLGYWVNNFWAGRGKDGLPDWPPYILLPMAAWYAIASERLAAGGELTVSQAGEISRLAAIGAWRYSQGIYRIAPELMTALLDSPPEGKIPTDVLHRLPEWSIYIETPGMRWREIPQHGFWAHLEWDPTDEHEELRLLLDTEGGLLPYPLHLGGDMDAALAGFLAQAQKFGVVDPHEDAAIRGEAKELSRLLSLVLYLCSDAPEIDGGAPGKSPQHPRPTRIKGGRKLFPAAGPTIWHVGRETAATLRKSTPLPHSMTERTLRVHLRRGHWHGYWTGPKAKAGETPQKFSLRWLYPLIAGGKKRKRDDDSGTEGEK